FHEPAGVTPGTDRPGLPRPPEENAEESYRHRGAGSERRRFVAPGPPPAREGHRPPARRLAGLVARLALLEGHDAALCLSGSVCWSDARTPFRSLSSMPSTRR